jgi:hypothetical protein
MWKMDAYHGAADHFTISNSIIRQDLANHECNDDWPAGTYSNVKLVWEGGGAYPAKLPAGVTLVTGQAGLNLWNNAVNDWQICHGYKNGTVVSGTGFDTCSS